MKKQVAVTAFVSALVLGGGGFAYYSYAAGAEQKNVVPVVASSLAPQQNEEGPVLETSSLDQETLEIKPETTVGPSVQDPDTIDLADVPEADIHIPLLTDNAAAILSGTSSFTYADSPQNVTTDLSSQLNVEPNAIKPGTWVKAGFSILKYASNTWLFHREATESVSPEAITISTGSIGFNNAGSSGYGSSAKHVVYINGIGQLFDTWPETSALHWLEKLSVIITDESNGNDVVSKTATHEQHVYYTATHHGNYTVRWVDDAKMKWDLWLTVWDAAYGGLPNGSNMSQIADGQIQTVRNLAGEEKKVKRYKGSYYFIPSNEHKNNSQFDKNKSLSIIDLQDQLYDNVVGKEVEQFKNYNSGDIIYVEDTIQTVEYDQENNRTIFGFEAKDDEVVRWAFNGDLTDNFNVGKELKLGLTVVPIFDEFETLDYLEKAKASDKAPELDDYLVK